jgi:phage baseplate assembly protein gpV
MSKVTQYSRISHHTLAGSASATFSVPASEDFTDGSWSIYDLALSEIGINEDSKKAYIRINDEVKEFEFIGGTAGAENLSDTLAVGNTTGPHDIVIDTTQSIVSSNGSGKIELDAGGNTNFISLSSTGTSLVSGNQTTDILHIDPSEFDIGTSILSNDDVNGNATQLAMRPDTMELRSTYDASNITDRITLDPQGLGNGTGILSEDTPNNYSSQLYLSPTNNSLFVYDINLTNYTVGLENGYLPFSNGIYSKIVAQNTAGISSAIVEVSVDLTVDKSQITLLADTTKMDLPAYADDATAGTALLTTGTLYQTDGTGASPLDVAGIVMIKQ